MARFLLISRLAYGAKKVLGFSAMNNIYKFLATGLGLGYIPFAPGTFGTLLGVLMFYLLNGLPLIHYILFLAVFIVFASWVSGIAQGIFADKDPQKVVIDEVAGYLVTMTGCAWDWKLAVAGFVLFRIFDIWKPFPIRAVEKKLSTGFGIVIDDVLAGVYAGVVLYFVTRYL